MTWQSSLSAIAAVLDAGPQDARFHYPIRHGTMRVGLYAPRGLDDQTPHSQDEIYIVAAGSGTFVKGAERVPFAAGDVLFVEAGIEHRFEGFSPDFASWVVFWGPEGGERG